MTDDAPHDASLAGKFLIAMPGMEDPRFAQSVVLICTHDDQGAMGVIVNKPAQELRERALLEQIKVPLQPEFCEAPVYFGGPVEMSHGFVLHLNDGRTRARTVAVTSDIALTATMDILSEIGAGGGPAKHLLALGYAGWSPGQLEAEILRNGWLTVDADSALTFDCDDGEKWSAALGLLGVDPLTLSAAAGHA